MSKFKAGNAASVAVKHYLPENARSSSGNSATTKQLQEAMKNGARITYFKEIGGGVLKGWFENDESFYSSDYRFLAKNSENQ